MMPYGTTPNPGGVYKAWMTPLEAYKNANGDLDDIPSELKPGAVKKLPHPCPDFCAEPDPGFGPPRRYVKTDNFKVKEAPPMIHIFKFEDVNGNGYFDAGDKQIGPGTDQCVIEDNGSFKTVACSEPGAMGWPVDVCEDTNGDGTVDPGNTDAECTRVYTPAWINGAFDKKFLLVEVLPGDWVNSVIKVGDGDAFNAGSAICTQPSCDGSVEVLIPSYGSDKSVTFGNWKYSKKSGTKYHDTDADGDITDETLTLSGWTMFVDYNGNGSKDSGEPYDITDANGDYTITNIKPGTFKVREQLSDQPGWFCSYPNAGAGDVVFPGVVKSTACYHQEAFTSGSEFKDNDFGNWTTTTKSGLKFEDKDADGQPKETNEPGLSGWTIYVDYNGNGSKDSGEPSAITGSGGVYTITGIVPGTFKVREVLQDYWFCSFPNAGAGDIESPGVVKSSACYYQETFKSGVPETGNDFGNWKPGKKSGMKFSDIDYSNSYSYDDAPLSGFTFYVDYNDNGQLDPGEPYDESDANGDYMITGIVPGTWKVRELQKTGWTCVYPATKDAYGCYHQETFESQSVFTNNNFGNRAAEGCTPGYWKQDQHFDSWVPTGYAPEDMLTGLFEEIGYMPYKNHYADQDSGEDPVKMSLATLLNALQMGGGETVPDKAEILVRAAVAAVLNAEHPDVAYGLTSAWIVAAVNSALDSRDATAIIGLAGKLDKANNGENGCPLN
jgi:protocatechuate 3,4-dioxygenase beta subunit